MLSDLIRDPSNNNYMICFMDVDPDVMSINNNKNIQFLCEYLIYISSKAYGYVKRT